MQYCTNTVKHTISIIISQNLTQKPSQNEAKMKRIFLVKYVYYSPTIELKEQQTNKP
jgi:hypothetical protein